MAEPTQDQGAGDGAARSGAARGGAPHSGARPWEQAWQDALYGPRGFYRHHAPGDHFATSVQGLPGGGQILAEAVLALARRHGCGRVVDVGAGRGELLGRLRDLDPDLHLTGVDVVPAPPGFGVDRWLVSPGGAALPDGLTDLEDTLVVAHEWLDVVPCPVVERDAADPERWRSVLVGVLILITGLAGCFVFSLIRPSGVAGERPHHRRRDPQEVDAAMLEEVLVLGRDEGLQQRLGDGLDGLEQPPLARVFGQQRAVGRVHARRHRRLIVLQHRVVGKSGRHLRQIDAGDGEAGHGAEDAEAEEPAEQSQHQMRYSE